MRRMGRAAVTAELQRRRGRPAELIDDIGGEPPYPTREFCERWCTEQDNILFQFTPRMAVILTLVVFILACMVMARGDFARLAAGSASGMGGSSAPAAAGDAPRARVGPAGIFDAPAFQPLIPSQQQQHLQQQQQQQQQRQQQMMQFMQNTQPPQPTQ